MLEAEPCSPVLGYDLINRSIHTFRAGLVIAIAILQCIAEALCRTTKGKMVPSDGSICSSQLLSLSNKTVGN